MVSWNRQGIPGPERLPRMDLRGMEKSADHAAGVALNQLSVVKHLRLVNCFIASVGVFVGFAVASQHLAFSLKLLAGMVSVFLITGAGNMVNDFFDLEIDKRAWKQTPLATGELEPMVAFTLSMLLFIVGIAAAFLINRAAFMIAVFVSGMMIAYSGVMRNHKYVGNVVVAAGTALTIIFGASIIGNYIWASIFAFSAFLANIARELTKDLEDMAADRGVKKTLPMLLSFEWIRRIVFMLYAVAIMIAGTAWTAGVVKGSYFIVLLIAAMLAFFMAWEKLQEREFRMSQRYSKYGMMIALLAFISVVL